MLIARSLAAVETASFTTILGTVDALALKLVDDLPHRDRRECSRPVPRDRPLAEERLAVPGAGELADDPGGFDAVLLQGTIERVTARSGTRCARPAPISAESVRSSQEPSVSAISRPKNARAARAKASGRPSCAAARCTSRASASNRPGSASPICIDRVPTRARRTISPKSVRGPADCSRSRANAMPTARSASIGASGTSTPICRSPCRNRHRGPPGGSAPAGGRRPPERDRGCAGKVSSLPPTRSPQPRRRPGSLVEQLHHFAPPLGARQRGEMDVTHGEQRSPATASSVGPRTGLRVNLPGHARCDACDAQIHNSLHARV